MLIKNQIDVVRVELDMRVIKWRRAAQALKRGDFRLAHVMKSGSYAKGRAAWAASAKATCEAIARAR